MLSFQAARRKMGLTPFREREEASVGVEEEGEVSMLIFDFIDFYLM